jgi:acyl phosphate:glycerol-3-phosphate acyltransferase
MLLGYWVGSIPTGLWFCRYFFNLDITKFGSGNIGAANVYRTLGNFKYFVYIFLIDAGKAFLTLALANTILSAKIQPEAIQNFLLIISFAILLGNAHSIFMNFKGGKGVATTLGIIAYLIPLQLIIVFTSIWGLIFYTTGLAFLASIASTFLLTMFYWAIFFTPKNLLCYFLLFACGWLILRHKDNLRYFIEKFF